MELADPVGSELDLLDGGGDLLAGDVSALATDRDQHHARVLARLLRRGQLRYLQLLSHLRTSSCTLLPSGTSSSPEAPQRVCHARGRESHLGSLRGRARSMNRPSTLIGESRGPDVQARRPRTEVSLTRVGVRGVEKVIRINPRAASERRRRRLGPALLRRVRVLRRSQPEAGRRPHVPLRGGRQRGDRRVGPRRVAEGRTPRRRHRRARPRPPGRHARRGLPRGPLPRDRAGARSAASRRRRSTRCSAPRSPPPAGTRTLTGVQAQGMTACPCAQEMIAVGCSRAADRERLHRRRRSTRSSSLVPVATHNQRGIGTLYLGRSEECETEIDARELLAIVESSMSSEIYELMKREDERSVVEKAHANPRFVEDCVREMVRRLADRPSRPPRPQLHPRPPGEPGDDPPPQRRRGALRRALGGRRRARLAAATPTHHMTMREWLDAPAAPRRRLGRGRAGGADSQNGRAQVHDDGYRGPRLVGEPIDPHLPSGEPAAAAIEAELIDFDRRLSRFRPESELCRLNGDPGRRSRRPPLLRGGGAAVWGAERTNGLVDPTLVREIEDAGYRRSLAGVRVAVTASRRWRSRRRESARDPAAIARAGARSRSTPTAGRSPSARRRDRQRRHRQGACRRPDGAAAARLRPLGDRLRRRSAGRRSSTPPATRSNSRFATRSPARPPPRWSSTRAPSRRPASTPASGGTRATAATPTTCSIPPTGPPAWTGLIAATALAPTALEADVLAKAAFLSGPAEAAGFVASTAAWSS